MKQILCWMIVNLSGLVITSLGIIINIFGTVSQEGLGTALIILGAIVWLIGLVIFILTKENNSRNKK